MFIIIHEAGYIVISVFLQVEVKHVLLSGPTSANSKVLIKKCIGLEEFRSWLAAPDLDWGDLLFIASEDDFDPAHLTEYKNRLVSYIYVRT